MTKEDIRTIEDYSIYVGCAINDNMKKAFEKFINGEDEFVFTKEDICKSFGVSIETFRKFWNDFGLQGTVDRKLITNGKSRVYFYNQKVADAFGLWLKRNALNAGGQKTGESFVKQDNIQDVSIGFAINKELTENTKILELKLGIEKEITKQMKLVAKHCGLEERYKALKEEAGKLLYYKNTQLNVVYIGTDNNCRYKIGKAANLSQRSKIGTTDNPDLNYLYTKNCGTSEAASVLEETIKKELGNKNLQYYNPKTQSEEWFLLTPSDLYYIVEKYQFEKLIRP